MLAQFAGQGYIVTGADYFGMGTSTEEEGYMVKGSHQQATFDMLMASRAVLAQMKIVSPKLFFSGDGPEGGFVTMAFLRKPRKAQMFPLLPPPPPAHRLNVLRVALSGFLYFPRKNDADWVSTLFILSSFSFENYYGVPGLAHSLLNDAYYDVSRKAYEKQPFDMAQIPTDLHKLIRPEYFEPQYFANSAFGRLVADKAHAYRWVIRTQVRDYFGESDGRADRTGLGQLAATYQHAMGNGNPQVEAISTGKTSHRGTYATAVPQWKIRSTTSKSGTPISLRISNSRIFLRPCFSRLRCQRLFQRRGSRGARRCRSRKNRLSQKIRPSFFALSPSARSRIAFLTDTPSPHHLAIPNPCGTPPWASAFRSHSQHPAPGWVPAPRSC